MDLSKLLTIVIPCKNENGVIDLTLNLLNNQTDINNVKVIISDSSNDNTTYNLETRLNDKFKLDIIQGGLPSIARNNGARRTETSYILFIDADMYLLDKDLLTESMKLMKDEELDLLTVKVRTTNGKYNYVFRFFDLIQHITKYFSPFCLGGFMLIKKETFDNLGGFDETAVVAEDYLLSKQISGRRFKIHNKTVFTLPRRFENKGIWYMTKLMIQSFFNRNNKKFFENHKTYWK